MIYARVRPLAVSVFLATTTTAWAQSHAISTTKVTFVGTQTLTPGVTKGTLLPGVHVLGGLDVDVGFDIPGVSGNNRPARTPAVGVPTPAGSSISATGVFFGIPGLTQFDQAVAPTFIANGFNLQVEPPDMGLAVGNGLVFEAINDAIAISKTDGTPLTFAALSALYKVA